MERRSHVKGLQFWREAPRLGLTGVSEIEIAEGGVIAERAAYDLNVAFDVLCRRRWDFRARRRHEEAGGLPE